MAALIRAGAAGVRGDGANVRRHLERAAAGFGVQEMRLLENVARYCLESGTPSSSSLSAGPTTASPASSEPLQGRDWLLAHGVARLRPFAQMLATGCPQPE